MSVTTLLIAVISAMSCCVPFVHQEAAAVLRRRAGAGRLRVQ